MGTNFYAHIKAKYKPFDHNDPVSLMYERLDDDPKVKELTNGYVWHNTYYKDIERLNKDYCHILHIGKVWRRDSRRRTHVIYREPAISRRNR